jgi:hypothetical protein
VQKKPFPKNSRRKINFSLVGFELHILKLMVQISNHVELFNGKRKIWKYQVGKKLSNKNHFPCTPEEKSIILQVYLCNIFWNLWYKFVIMLGYLMVKEKYVNSNLVKSCAGKNISLVLQKKNQFFSCRI